MCEKIRWEYGSDFSYYSQHDEGIIKNKLYDKSIFLGTGRYALRLIIAWGIKRYKWKRIWVPSYFCPDVITTILSTGLITLFYYDDPITGFNLNDNVYEDGDVILVNNLFGYRSQQKYNSLPRNYIQIIEDHSHDPWSDWSMKSEADWCFASIRKSLPISDGAILWSPKEHRLPPEPHISSIHYLASLEKSIGMLLKTYYFQGMEIEKEDFRSFLIKGEKKIGTSKNSGITDFSKKLLTKIPISLIREKKNLNRNLLTIQIKNLNHYQILESSQNPGSCPFSVILYFNTKRLREFFLNSLIENHIYPAILWPLEKGRFSFIPYSNGDFSSRMLSIHCDFRYSFSDIDLVSEKIIKISEKYNSFENY